MQELIGQEAAWKLLLEDRYDKINKSGIRIYVPDELQSPDLNFGVILKVPDGANREIYRRLLESIPREYHANLLFQNPEWYHLTIQWAPEKEVAQEQRQNILNQVREIVEQTEQIRGKIRFPYLVDGGFMAAFFSETEGAVAHLKRRVQKVWHDQGIKLYLPEIYDEVAYISQSRVINQIDVSEIPKMKELPTQDVDIVFEKALIVLNDRIMTPERVQVLDSIQFKKS